MSNRYYKVLCFRNHKEEEPECCDGSRVKDTYINGVAFVSGDKTIAVIPRPYTISNVGSLFTISDEFGNEFKLRDGQTKYDKQGLLDKLKECNCCFDSEELDDLLTGVDNGDDTYTFTSVDGSISFTINSSGGGGGGGTWGSITGTLSDQTDLQDALDDKLDSTQASNIYQPKYEKGIPNGYAALDGSGKVIPSQLYPTAQRVFSLPATAELDSLWIVESTNILYQYDSISGFVEISPSIDLGETSTTAYRGDRGKAAYDHSQLTSGNPHQVTKSDVGLSNLDNLQQIPIYLKGASHGVAELDGSGKVPISQLPAYVDDVQEFDELADFPITGSDGIIYIAKDTNLAYRWTGSGYAEISPSLALGETSGTAYRGDRGKIAYDHSQLTSGNPHQVTKSDVGLGNVDNTSDNLKGVSIHQAAADAIVLQDAKDYTDTEIGGLSIPTQLADLDTTVTGSQLDGIKTTVDGLATVASTGVSTDLSDTGDLIRNDDDTWVSFPKVTQIVTLTDAEKTAATPQNGMVYLVTTP